MLRKFSLFLACLTLLFVCAARAEPDPKDFVGKWYLNDIRIPDYPPFHPSYLSLESVLTLNADGSSTNESATMGYTRITPGSWSRADGAVTILEGDDSEPQPCSLEDGNLVIGVEPLQLVYGREPTVGFVAPAPRTDARPEEFAGDWHISHLSVPGFGIMPVGSWDDWEETYLLSTISVRISGDQISIVEIYDSDPPEKHTAYAGLFRQENGALFMGESSDSFLELNTDGTLSWHLVHETDFDSIVYCQRIPEDTLP